MFSFIKNNSKLSGSILFGLFFLFQNELKILMKYSFDTIYDKIVASMQIDLKNAPRIFIGVEQNLKELSNKQLVVYSSNSSINYTPANGRYFIESDGKTIWIDYDGDKIIVSTYSGIEVLENYINKINVITNAPEHHQFYYTMSKDGWSYPILRKPSSMQIITRDMQLVLDDVEKFKSGRGYYELNGLKYRRGYVITGEKGTGKTTVVDIIAKMYGMSVYTCILNTFDLDDAKLCENIANVPENSIIFFDEFDKQYQVITGNNPRKISDGGLLSIMDGLPPLSYGSIIIIAANDLSKIGNEEFREYLIRPGRIDVEVVFKTKINKSSS